MGCFGAKLLAMTIRGETYEFQSGANGGETKR